MRYFRILVTMMALLPGLLSFATSHRGTVQLKDWTPARGDNGPEIESITVKWAFSDRGTRPDQTFFMQWYLGRDYFYQGERYQIAELGDAANQISFTSLVLEADLYADDRKVSTVRFDMGATPPHGGTWGPEVRYEWSLSKLFPRLSQAEAERAFADAYLELKDLRIREAWFGGERQLLANLETPKSTPDRNSGRYEPIPSEEDRYPSSSRNTPTTDRWAEDPRDREPSVDDLRNQNEPASWEREPAGRNSRLSVSDQSRYDALILLADSAMARYEYTEAQSYYDQALDIDPRGEVALQKRRELQDLLSQRDAYATLVEVLREGYAQQLQEVEREQEAALKLALMAVSEPVETCALQRYQWAQCQAEELLERQRKANLEARLRVYEPQKAPPKELTCGEAPCELKKDDPRARVDNATLARRKYNLYQEIKEEVFLNRSRELLQLAREQNPEDPEVWLTTALLEEDPLEALVALNTALELDNSLVEARALQEELENSLLEQVFAEMSNGKTGLLKESIAKGLVTAQTTFQGTSLMSMAIEKEQTGLITELLAQNTTARSANGGEAQSWLFEAAKLNKTKAAAILIGNGARPDIARASDGATPLSVAASAGSKEVLRLFLKDASPDLDASEALAIVVRDKDYAMVSAILQSGAKANPIDQDGNNLLQSAVQSKDPQLVQLLLDNKLNVNHTNKAGATALAIAAQQQDSDLVQTLLNAGGLPEPALTYLAKSSNDGAAWLAGELFTLALEEDRNDWLSLGLEYDPELPLKRHSSGKTYLTYTLEANKWDLCATLLSNKQLPLDQKIDGENFFFRAVNAEAIPVVQALTQQNAISMSQTNAEGLSALHLAVDKGNLELAQVLVQGGHPLELQDSRDNTPLHRALIVNQPEIAEYLSSVDHTYESLNNRGQHPIHLAIREGQINVVGNLLANGTDVNLVGESGMAPLHYAAEERSYEMAQVLVEAGADLGFKDAFGRTPRKIARDNNDDTLAELLKGDLRDRIPEVKLPEIRKPEFKLPKILRRNG